MAEQEKPTSKYELKGRMAIEATHPHNPPVAWCNKCKLNALGVVLGFGKG